MPQIPHLQTQNISTNSVDLAQGPSIARSDIAAEAWGQLGGTVARIGEQLMEKRKKSDTSSFLNSKKNELARLKATKSTEVGAKYTGDPTGYASEINGSLKEWGDSQTDMAPNDDAKQEWENYLSSYITDSTLADKAKEDRDKAQYHAGLIDEDVFKNRQLLAQQPDPTLALDFMNNTAKSINDGIGLYHNETEAKDKLRKYGADYTGTLLEGFENSKRYGQGLRFLSGQDPESAAFLQYADPKQIQAYKDRFQRLGEQESELSKRVFNSQIGDVSSALMQGMNVPDEVINDMYSKTSFLKPDEKAIVVDNLNSAKQYNAILKDLKTKPISEIRNLSAFEIPRSEGDIFNLNSRQQMASMYQKAASDILNKKVNDGAGFIIENDKTVENLSKQAMDLTNPGAMKEYSTQVVEKQKLDGVLNVKVLDKTMSKVYGSVLTAPNPEAANTAFYSLKTGFGDKFGNVVSELIQNDSITPSHAMAMYLPDDNSRIQSFANIAKKKEIDAAYSKVSTGRSELSDVFNDSDLQEIKKAVMINDSTNSRLWLNNGIDSLVELEYKNLRANGASEKEAKTAALNKIVKNNLSVANSKNSSVVISKDYIQHKSVIQDYMTESLSQNRLQAMDFKIDPAYINQANILGKDPVESYKKDLSKNGIWLTNNAQNGVVLAKKTPNGYAKVLSADGKQIERSFDDMVKAPIKQYNYKEVGF